MTLTLLRSTQVTPTAIRLRKAQLNSSTRKTAVRRADK